MPAKAKLHRDHIVPGSGPVLTLDNGADAMEFSSATGLLCIEIAAPGFLTPRVTDLYLQQFMVQEEVPYLDKLFKQLRAKMYNQEIELLDQIRPDMLIAQWRLIFLSMCTQCAFESCASLPFLEQDAKRWLRAKFIGQKQGRHFDERWEVYKNEYALRKGEPGPFYLRTDTRIHAYWAHWKE